MLDCSGQGAGAEQAAGKENKDWEMSLQHSYVLQWWGQNGRSGKVCSGCKFSFR